MCGECINPWGNLEYDNFSPFQVNANKCLLCSLNGCNEVRRKEGSGQGWLVETRVIY